jgi:hypothetical protein
MNLLASSALEERPQPLAEVLRLEELQKALLEVGMRHHQKDLAVALF